MSSLLRSSKDLCTFFYDSVIHNDTSKNGEWVCKKCGKKKLKSGGWTNLLNHLRSCVGPLFEEQFDSSQQHHKSRITSYVLRVSEAEHDVYKWIEWIVMKNLPISMVDDPLTREAVRYKPLGSKSLRKYILSVCNVMKESVKCKLPNKFAIVFDGWSEGTTHYIGVSASYVTSMTQHGMVATTSSGEEQQVVCHTLLSMRPLLTGEVMGMTAQDHLHHLSLVLQSYGKTDDNVLCLIGDNCSVNKSMSRLLKVPLIGCGAHKFNLAVNKWISNQPQLEEIIQRVANVMKKASTLKVSAQLRKLTSLHTVRQNDTRWSSTFEMISRFFRIQAELSAVSDLLPMLPSLVECEILRKGFVHLKEFNQVTVMLQKEGITLLRVREIFDSVIDDYTALRGHLSSDAAIVVNPVFERAVVKISRGLDLSDEERLSVKCLLLPTDDDPNNNTSTLLPADVTPTNGGTAQQQELSYAQKLELRIKRRKKSNDNIALSYMNLDVLAGTSVSCERLFSAAKFILTDLRKSTSPSVFEAILLLKVNRSEWDVHTVGKALGRTSGAPGFGFGPSSSTANGVCEDGNDDQADDNDLDIFYD